MINKSLTTVKCSSNNCQADFSSTFGMIWLNILVFHPIQSVLIPGFWDPKFMIFTPAWTRQCQLRTSKVKIGFFIYPGGLRVFPWALEKYHIHYSMLTLSIKE